MIGYKWSTSTHTNLIIRTLLNACFLFVPCIEAQTSLKNGVQFNHTFKHVDNEL